MDAIEKKTRDLLTSVKSAPSAMLYLSVKAAAAAVAAGMLIQNSALADDKGSLATKLTPFGVNYLASPEGTDPTTVEGDKTIPAPDEAATGAATAVSELKGRGGQTFARVRIALPASSNTRQSSYPTDDLLPPDADGNLDGIFLEPNAKVTDPAKAYPAVASAANKRHKNDKPPRKFTSRVMDGAPFGKPGVQGVGIFRVE